MFLQWLCCAHNIVKHSLSFILKIKNKYKLWNMLQQPIDVNQFYNSDKSNSSPEHSGSGNVGNLLETTWVMLSKLQNATSNHFCVFWNTKCCDTTELCNKLPSHIHYNRNQSNTRQKISLFAKKLFCGSCWEKKKQCYILQSIFKSAKKW